MKDINWSGKQILIAEDNAMNFTLLKNILDKTKVEVLWARNGQEAVELVQQHPSICLVLMDIIMPVMDGFEATLEIKKINPGLPVIAQTAHSIENEKETMEQYGFSGFLTKPIWHYELILKASKYLDDK
ncbi:MAG: response regulator [Chlorobi bacterium]|nr:response regulator [Chlorobiota bacterium]